MTTSAVPARSYAVLGALAVAVLIAAFSFVWSREHDASSWDVPLYQRYGERIAGGDVPYRDFRVEYPPGALATFVLPSEIARTATPVWTPRMGPRARRYAFAFAALMIVLLAATIAVTAVSLYTVQATITKTTVALAMIAASPLLLGDLVFTRFDAWPALLTAAALGALLRDRFTLAGVSIGVGIATKLYPALLLPLGVAYAWKRRGRGKGILVLATTIVAAGAVFLPFVVISASGTAWPVRAQLTRGLQAESLGASLLSGLHVLTFQLHRHGVPVPTAPLHLVEGSGAANSAEIVGVEGHVVGALSGVATIAVLLWAWVSFARRDASRHRLVAFSAIVMSSQIGLGRVLSPQFVIWLIPLVPLVRGRRGYAASALLALSLVLTHIWFPGPYRQYVNNVASGETGPTVLLLVRNVLLVALLVTLVVRRAPRCLEDVAARAKVAAAYNP